MPKHKKTLVADYSYYPIPISEIEKRIISTQIFNRLHNILQDSTVFFTYPSNRTSRFSHSLGSMHLAGEILRNSIINAEEGVRRKFFSSVGETIDMICDSDAFVDDTRSFLHQRYRAPAIKNRSVKNCFDSPFYLSALPGFLTPKMQYNFIVIFQAVRLVALMHDLGHPPFSHVVEFAIGELLDHLQDKAEDKKGSLNDKETEFLGLVTPDFLTKGKFHESLGTKLEIRLLSNLIYEFPKGTEGEKRFCYGIVIIKHFAQRILEDRTDPLFVALKTIIDSDLDADRLDYVPRGISHSGFGKEQIALGRLLTSYQLVYHPRINKSSDRKASSPMFLPSARSLSTIELFYHRRFALYNYVIYHHRVVKTDGLLKSAIVDLAKQELADNSSPSKNSNPGSYLLPDNISGLWHILDPRHSLDQEKTDRFIQWDDAWLLSVLRKHYFEIKNSRENRGVGKQEDVTPLEMKLEEVISNKKGYHSLYKRVDTYFEVEKAFLTAAPAKYQWDVLGEVIGLPKDFSTQRDAIHSTLQLENAVPKIEYYIRLVDYFDEVIEARNNNTPKIIGVLKEHRGLFTAILVRLLISSGKAGRHGLSFATKALSELKGKYGLTDIIIMPKLIKPGVKNDLLLVQDNMVLPLGTISQVAIQLKRASLLFPPFFVYIYNNRNFSVKEFSEMRTFLGKALWRSFTDWVQQEKNNRIKEGDKNHE